MQLPSLEVTYRRGRPLAAYFRLPGSTVAKVFKSREAESGLVVDFARDGTPIGVEITAPRAVTLAVLNRVLKELGQAPASAADLRPLRAAS
jgi:hypothetical protein